MCSVPPDTGVCDDVPGDEDEDEDEEPLQAASPATATRAAVSPASRFSTLVSVLSVDAAIHEVHRQSAGRLAENLNTG